MEVQAVGGRHPLVVGLRRPIAKDAETKGGYGEVEQKEAGRVERGEAEKTNECLGSRMMSLIECIRLISASIPIEIKEQGANTAAQGGVEPEEEEKVGQEGAEEAGAMRSATKELVELRASRKEGRGRWDFTLMRLVLVRSPSRVVSAFSMSPCKPARFIAHAWTCTY